MGWSTQTDAIQIARLITDLWTGDASKLHAETGWSKRRFNPAFKLLISIFPPGRISMELQPNYPSASIVLRSEDKVTLRRFIERLS